MKRWIVFLLLATAPLLAQEQLAKNVILFLGDAGGIPTLNAASTYGYNEPRRLFLQRMPHIALAETTSASEWVTDSAAGMTAIVTGYKTHNGVISQSDSAVRGVEDGKPLKTILEYAEEQGLSTGIVSNSSVASATPAACYAHVNDRSKTGEIFAQVLKPRFGDGVDVIIGAGRKQIIEETRKLGLDVQAALKANGYALHDSLDSIRPDTGRVVALFNNEDFNLDAATQRAIDILSRNPKGFFLMVESDLHTENIVQGLERTVAFDQTIRRTVERAIDNTLVLFTADHSYAMRVHDGKKGEPLLAAAEKALETNNLDFVFLRNVRRDDDHTGEEVLVAAQGPGAERVRGILSNTDLFRIMMSAFGWPATSPVQLENTVATEKVGDDPDDPAIWVHSSDPEKSLILGTDKADAQGALYVFGLDGKVRQRISGLDRPNNVDVEYGVMLAGRPVDIAVLTERNQRRLRVYKIDPNGAGLSEVSSSGGVPVFEGQSGEQAAPMGIALYRRPGDGAVFAIVGRKTGPRDGYLWQYRLEDDGSGKIKGTKVREFGRFSGSGEIEAIAVDDTLGYVYYADEGDGIHKWHADPNRAGANVELAHFGREDFKNDREGIAVYARPDGTGYIICTDQVSSNSEYRVYRREGKPDNPHDHSELVAVLRGDADSTDGIEATSSPLTAQFPKGLLVVMNSAGRNFLVYAFPGL